MAPRAATPFVASSHRARPRSSATSRRATRREKGANKIRARDARRARATRATARARRDDDDGRPLFARARGDARARGATPRRDGDGTRRAREEIEGKLTRDRRDGDAR